MIIFCHVIYERPASSLPPPLSHESWRLRSVLIFFSVMQTQPPTTNHNNKNKLLKAALKLMI